ncbi:MAG: DUF3168 domain-containing protein [Pseudomonadota bacterium]
MSAALAVQKAIRARLMATSAVTDLVAAASIVDAHGSKPDPCIVIGEAQLVDEGLDLKRRTKRIIHDLHVWKKEPGLEGANHIAGTVQDAIDQGRFQLDDGYDCVDLRTSGIRSMRDPDGETSHAVVTVDTLVFRVSS